MYLLIKVRCLQTSLSVDELNNLAYYTQKYIAVNKGELFSY